MSVYFDPTHNEWVGGHATTVNGEFVSRQTEWFATKEQAQHFSRTGERPPLILTLNYLPEQSAQYPWYYSLDFPTADGKPDFGLSSFDFGNVETEALARQAAAEAEARWQAGLPG
jgi:hypothetical protein